MQEILLGVGVFTVMVFILVAVILLAKSKLVASGDITIEIENADHKQIKVPAGGKLLNALADQKSLFPLPVGAGVPALSARSKSSKGVEISYPPSFLTFPKASSYGRTTFLPGDLQAEHENRSA